MQTKYLAHFERLKDKFVLNGNRILVEILPKEEMKTQGGIVIASDLSGYKTQTEDKRPLMAMIVCCGDAVDEQWKPGMVCWITKHPTFYSEFPGIGATENKLALITDDPNDIHMSWENLSAYEAYKKEAKNV